MLRRKLTHCLAKVSRACRWFQINCLLLVGIHLLLNCVLVIYRNQLRIEAFPCLILNVWVHIKHHLVVASFLHNSNVIVVSHLRLNVLRRLRRLHLQVQSWVVGLGLLKCVLQNWLELLSVRLRMRLILRLHRKRLIFCI